MNAAQIHLGLNHLPVVGILFGTMILLVAMVLKNRTVRATGLALLLFASLTSVPVFLSGEPAEELVEERPGVSESDIHEHEEAGEFALVIALLTGVAAAGALATTLRPELAGGRFEKPLTIATLILALAANASLLRTAHLGGLIRHEELKDQGKAASPLPISAPLHSIV